MTFPNGDLIFGTAGKGVCLGVTSNTDANTLDDYEEGVHTVSASDSGASATITMNTSYDQLAYTKIGRVVHIQGILLFSAVSTTLSGALIITLPFTSSDLQDASGRTILNVGTYQSDWTAGTAPYFDLSESSASATLQVALDNGNSGQGRVTTSTQLYIQGTYFTDS